MNTILAILCVAVMNFASALALATWPKAKWHIATLYAGLALALIAWHIESGP